MKDSLTALSARLSKMVQDWPDTVPAEHLQTEAGRVHDGSPDIADRLSSLAQSYPDGVSAELVDVERRRCDARSEMAARGLLD